MKTRLLLASVASLGLICGGAVAAPAAAESLDASQCAALTGMVIPAGQIGLPTTGARIASAKIAAGAPGTPNYCMVTGWIDPVDATAPGIEFNLGLPLTWNGKAFMLGGGGTDGFIPAVTGSAFTTQGSPAPLALGYAVFSSDSGHKNKNANPVHADASFALNAEALQNFRGDALKKTRDVSYAIIRRAYGKAPERAYFIGGSGGGREAFVVMARWPADWDGVVAMYPAADSTLVRLGILSIAQALAEPGGYPSPEKRALVHQAAMQACDDLDGLKDGVISNVRGCYGRFDPATATLNGAPLRCLEASTANCVTNAELATFKRIDSPFDLPFPSGAGLTRFPGFNAYTSDTGRPPTTPDQAQTTFFGFGLKQPAIPIEEGMPFVFETSQEHFRYVFTRDPSFDARTFNISNPSSHAARLKTLMEEDRPNLALDRFFRRGGKLMILQGTDDLEISPRHTEALYASLQKASGREVVERAVRYYEVPGFAHTVSATFNARWNPAPAIAAWVERGVDPGESLVVTDVTGVPGRTRPLCRYPAWPKYRGAGDPDRASSFTCAAP